MDDYMVARYAISLWDYFYYNYRINQYWFGNGLSTSKKCLLQVIKYLNSVSTSTIPWS